MNNLQAEKATEAVLDVVKEAKKTTGKIGFGQIGAITPNWAQWMFRFWFYGGQIFTLYMTLMSKLPAEQKLATLAWLAFLSMVVHILSRMVGIDSKKLEAEAKQAVIDAQAP